MSNRKNDFRYRLISLVVIALVVVLLTPVLIATPALAYDSNGPVSDFTAYNNTLGSNVTYYDIYDGITTGRPDLSNQLLFFHDVVKNRANLTNWSYLGYEILKNGGGETAYWDHAGHGFDGEFGTDGNYFDLTAQWDSNLKIANSLQAVDLAARQRVSDYFVTDNGNRRIGTGDIEGITEWADDDTIQPVFYTDAFDVDNDIGQRYYNYFGLAFYDFKLSLLADENLTYNTAADGYDSIKSAADAGAVGVSYQDSPGSGNGFVSGVTNYSKESVLTTQETSNSTTATVSNSIENSESYSYSEMIGANLSFTGKPPGVEIQFQIYTEFTTGQVYTSAYTSGTENSKTTSNTSSVQVTLPGHTQALLKQTDETMTATMNYDCPVVLTYKVAVYSLCGHCYWDGLIAHAVYKNTHYLATFGKDTGGANAVQNLSSRIKYSSPVSIGQSYEDTYGDGLNWNNIYYSNTTPEGPRVVTSVDWLISHMPMSVTGAMLSYDYKALGSEVYGLQPLYPLKQVLCEVPEIYMTYGQYQYVDTIQVTGEDKDNVPYYGFDKKYGHWILLDSYGNDVTTTSSVATLYKNAITGKNILQAGNTRGTVYMKYLIDENRYSYGSSQIYTTNNDLSSTAVITVNVIPATTAGSTGPDNDGDGVPANVEDAAPNNGDGNYDGIPDSQQANVASLPNAVNGQYATIASPSGTSLDYVSTVNVDSLPSEGKPSVMFPAGLFSFNIPGLTPGQTVTVTITLQSPVPVGTQYWKYGPTPDNHTPHWYQITMGDDDGDKVITIPLTDGGLGDDDLQANGMIVDQGGPGSQPSMSVGGTVQFPVDGSGSSSPPYAVIIGGTTAALAALALGVWFARRRWLRRCS